MRDITSLISLFAIMGFSTFSYAQECPTLDPIQIVVEPEVGAAIDQAWIDSQEGTVGEHEEGFFAYHCRSIKPAVCPEEYEYTTVIDRFPTGTLQRVGLIPVRTDLDCRLVLAHHTHPGVARNSTNSNDPFANDRQSTGDKNTLARLGVPGTISWGLGDNPRTTMTIYYNPPLVNTPNWFCSDSPPATSACESTPPSASTGPGGHSFGDPHLLTFDSYIYDFQLVGEFILAESEDGSFKVQSRQQPAFGSNKVSMNVAAAMYIAGDIVELRAHTVDESGLLLNSEPVLLDLVSSIDLDNGGRIERDTDKYTLIWPDGSNVKIDTNASYIDVDVRVATQQKGRMSGLLGDYDGQTENELVLQGESLQFQPFNLTTLHGAFANSWRVTPENSLFSYSSEESTETYTDKDFPAEFVTISSFSVADQAEAEESCRNIGVNDPLLVEACVIDLLATGETTFLQSAANVQDSLTEPLTAANIPPAPPSGDACPCGDLFTSTDMNSPPWKTNFLQMLTAPGEGCSLSNTEAFLQHESMTLLPFTETQAQTCWYTVGSPLEEQKSAMTATQHNACLDVIQDNARDWYNNGNTLVISRNFQSAVPVNSVDEISCLR